ncbi:hypothetical protein O6P43_026969 [Quillaja saponaria]|uniref:Uncharacterized protein n=1 Tax=Quillaja saponaria TaxID=32244 RepID=A0AAD7L3B8_QUISA|nr:hypothetical protein O6P43_026969 [Quillaja saponaria]
MANHTNTAASTENEHLMEHIINISEDEQPLLWPESCIYKVPCDLRNINEAAYTPRLISIGPIHHGDKKLKPMERQKKIYHHEFHKRLKENHYYSSETAEMKLTKFRRFIEENQDEIAHRYAAEFKKEGFVEMIELDAVFIMELFLRITETNKCQRDYMLSKPWLRKGIQLDLLLLENQIPFFILKELYEVVGKKHSTFLEIACQYFANFNPLRESSNESIKLIKEFEVRHFTDLVRCFYLPNTDLNFESETSDVLYCATKLNEGGVVFKAMPDKPLLDITFKKKWFLNWLPFLSCLPFIKCFNAHLELSPFRVDSTTECVLRNLIALEQCHYPSNAYICNYLLLMDHLVNTVTDVDLLVDKKVIVNQLGSHKQGTMLVNSLCEHVVVSNFCYAERIRQLNEHCDQFWNRNMAALNSIYFRDLWRSTSTVVALIIILATMYNFLRNFLRDYNRDFNWRVPEIFNISYS